MRSIILAVTMIFLLMNRASPQSSSPVAEIEAVLSHQAEAWNSGNLSGYMEGYWKSDSLLFTSGGTLRRGWQSTFEKYRRTYSSRQKMGRLSFSQLEVRLLSDSSAWVFGAWELARTSDHPAGLFTLLLKKFPAGWRIIHDHTSSIDTDSTKH